MVLALVSVSVLSIYFFLVPVLKYFRDAKGLRKYPNLFPASGISDLPMVVEAHRGFPSQTILKAHLKHPVVRIGPNTLSFSEAQAIKDIYGHNTKCTKDTYYSIIVGSHHSLFDEVDKPEHARKRKMMSNAYAIKNLEEWEHKVADMTGRLIKQFDDKCTSLLPRDQKEPNKDEMIDYRLWTNLFTFAAISNIGVSEDTGLIEQGNDFIDSESMEDGTVENLPFRKCLFARQWATANLRWSYRWFRFLIRLSKIFSPTYRRKWRLAKGFSSITYRRATKRLQRYQAGEKLDDFFSALMENKTGEPNYLEWGEIVSEVGLMIDAGSDTTAIAVSNNMYLLLKHPDCMARLRAEIDNILDEDEVVAPYEKIKHLPYLLACINESLRMWPPLSMGLPRRTPPEGCTIMGEFIPGDTTVSMSSYIVHRNPRNFLDPDIYRPERWFGETGKDLQAFFIPFSTGARGCIGRNISYLEQTVLLASLVHRYEFALSSPDWEPQRWEASTQGMRDMPVKVWRRQREGALFNELLKRKNVMNNEDLAASKL